MINRLIHIFSLFLLLIGFQAKAQMSLRNFDAVYGLDTKLYNGRVYSGYYNSFVKGHQFYEGKEFQNGQLITGGQLYKGKNLNYDIYQQKLLLSFKSTEHGHQIIELPLEHIRSFSLNNTYFEVIKWEDSSLKIVQSIGENDFKILLYWSKTLDPVTTTGSYHYQFSNIKKQIWILKNNKRFLVRNNKTLRKLYPKDKANALKQWMRSKHINIRKAGDYQLKALANYCKGL